MRALLLLLLAVPAYAEWTEDYMADRMDRNRDYQAETAAEERHQEVMQALSERRAPAAPSAYYWPAPSAQTPPPYPVRAECASRPNQKARVLCSFLIDQEAAAAPPVRP